LLRYVHFPVSLSSRGLLVLTMLLGGFVAGAEAQLRILTTTGEMRDGLPVVHPHPDAAATERALTRGYSGRLLRLYALEQEFLRQKTGATPAPAYLVLSDRQGGFPKFGFYLDEVKQADVGWVDLHRDSRLSGRFGAMDQIFPHELLHVIVHQLAGEPRESGGNQVHAVAVRTDPVNAFSEGFAEHAQILAVDDADADEETRGLPGQEQARARADREVAAYARDLARRWWPVQPSRLRFMLWFSQSEQVLRYHAVKANLFARKSAVPDALLTRADPYPAYLFQSVVPGTPNGTPKPASVILSTDGGVAHLIWRLVTDPSLQQRYRDDAFYASFGAARPDVTPLDNVYLKIFAALYEGRAATAAGLLRAWARVHPEDAADLERIAHDALLGQALPDAPELWLANDALMTGTSLFDQYRALPRPHTFDVNAAMPLDWTSVPGVTTEVAARLLADAPYPSVDALLKSPALTEPVRARIAAMSAAMAQLLARAAGEEETLSLWAIARAYLWRLGALLMVATVAGAGLARVAGVRRWWTAILVALVATLLVITFAWVITSPAWYPFAAPVIVGGVPWAAWRLARRRDLHLAAMALAAWALATLPGLLLTRSW
jgi:hypothetical protein